MAEADDTAAALLAALGRQDTRDAQFFAWAKGTITGGPNGDGKYPLPTGVGTTELMDCPARVKFDARKVPRISIAGSNTVTIDPVAHQGAFLEIVGGQASSNVNVNIPQSIPAEFNCMFAAKGSGKLIFDITGDGGLINDQSFDRTRGTGSVGGLYVASKDSSNRPTIYLYGSLDRAA